MFWSKKQKGSPREIPLSDILLCLTHTSIEARLEGDALVARHEKYTTRVEVFPPESDCVQREPIKAVVQIKTELPSDFVSLFKLSEISSLATINAFASLGSLIYENGKAYLGSRLTIYEVEDPIWRTLHLPLVLFTVIQGAEAQIGGLRRALSGEPGRSGESDWTAADFAPIEQYLSQSCLCTTSGVSLTAEFGLKPGEFAALAGHRTALFQLMADQPHPEVGGGIFSLLQLPHQIEDEKKLLQTCSHLNRLEMEAKDLVPHFGAWSPSKSGKTLAYVSFFGNPFYQIPKVAINIAIWGRGRAEWATQQLESIGIKL